MFYYDSSINLDIIKETLDGSLVICIDSEIKGKQAIINHIERSLNSPYEKDNWDGFEEAIGELYWLDSPRIRIIHYELPSLSQVDMEIYLNILKRAHHYWAMPPICDVKIYFADTLKESVKHYLKPLH